MLPQDIFASESAPEAVIEFSSLRTVQTILNSILYDLKLASREVRVAH